MPWEAWGDHHSAGTPASDRRLRPELAAAFTGSVYDALLQQCKGLDGEALQREVYSLREREWPYYRQAQQASLPAVPDLSDASGGLSNPVFFNFLSYILWKVAGRHVKDPLQRQQLNRRAGQFLAERALPESLRLAALSAAAPGSNGRAAPADLKEALVSALQTFKVGGYVDDYRIAFGGTPNLPDQPYGEPISAVDVPASEDAAGLEVFQVTLRAPADILGSVSLRGEEDGWFGRAASAALTAVLAAGGWPAPFPDEFFFQDEWRGPRTLGERALLLLGDPLQTVEVPWVPTSLIQDWRLGSPSIAP